MHNFWAFVILYNGCNTACHQNKKQILHQKPNVVSWQRGSPLHDIAITQNIVHLQWFIQIVSPKLWKNTFETSLTKNVIRSQLVSPLMMHKFLGVNITQWLQHTQRITTSLKKKKKMFQCNNLSKGQCNISLNTIFCESLRVMNCQRARNNIYCKRFQLVARACTKRFKKLCF